MKDPAFDVQRAIYSSLTTDAGIKAAMGTVSVYDRVPQNPVFPFLHIGDDQVLLGESYQYSATSTVHVLVHVFSRYVGKSQIKQIAGAVRSALETNISVSNFQTVTYEYVSTHYMLDPDGLTEHAVVEVQYQLAALV